jgi:hypothetical protein
MKLTMIHFLGLAALGGGAYYLVKKPAAPAPGTTTTTTTSTLPISAAQQAQLNAANAAQLQAMLNQGLAQMGMAAQTPQPDEQTNPTSSLSDLAQQGQSAATDAATNAAQQLSSLI